MRVGYASTSDLKLVARLGLKSKQVKQGGLLAFYPEQMQPLSGKDSFSGNGAVGGPDSVRSRLPSSSTLGLAVDGDGDLESPEVTVSTSREPAAPPEGGDHNDSRPSAVSISLWLVSASRLFRRRSADLEGAILGTLEVGQEVLGHCAMSTAGAAPDESLCLWLELQPSSEGFVMRTNPEGTVAFLIVSQERPYHLLGMAGSVSRTQITSTAIDMRTVSV